MKRLLIPLLFLFMVQPLFAEVYKLDEKSSSWAKETKGFSYTKETNEKYKGEQVFKIVHPNSADFAVTCPQLIKVKPGDIYTVTCFMKIKSDKSAAVGIEAVSRLNQKTVSWGLGRVRIERETGWEKVTSKFIVPDNVDELQPRISGDGAQTTYFAGFRFEKTGQFIYPDKNKTQTLENAFLKVTLFERDGTFNVFDKRTGRLWQQKVFKYPMIVRRAKQSKNRIDFIVFSASSFLEYQATIALDSDKPELTALIDKKDRTSEQSSVLYWPAPFVPDNKDRIILPLNEGISFPVTEKPYRLSSLYTYGGHGLCMGFWANVEDRIGSGGAGCLCIVETPDDMRLQLECFSPEKDGTPLIHAMPGWESQQKKFGYKRQLRYVFFDKGGHVAACKRYREYSKTIGLYCPFTEKIKKNPNLKKGFDLLIGSANIWYFSSDHVKAAQEMKAVGMDKLLWSAGGSPQDLKTLNAMGGILTSRYDIYQDLMDPANLEKVGRHPDWTQDAWPNDINWTDSDGTYRRGWGVYPKGVKATDPGAQRIRCAVLCDSKALPYAEKRIAEELKTRPYQGRFIDTTVAAPWYECYHPDHPMTRTDSKNWKMKLLALMGERFNLVCGSETGHEASVPYCDFYEGMTSLGPYRLPHGGWTAEEFNDPSPEAVIKYQVGIDYRLPLWELVYHDCTVSYYYWYDFSNRHADLWPKRDLISALYGVPPMYRLTRAIWDKQKDLFAASYKVACQTARETGWTEMIDHRILTEDRLVQQTFFANGVRVTANFGNKPFTCSDGFVLAPMKSRFEKK